MSLAAGHSLIAIPGPSPLPDRVLRAAHRASPDIYGDELADLNLSVMARLKRLAGCSGHVAPYAGNGHAGWEAAAANLFSRGDVALVLCSGHFGRSWAAHLAEMGVAVEVMDFGDGPADPGRLAQRLAADRDGRVSAVLVCQIDTASSCQTDIAAIRDAIGDHPALLVVDAIASLGCTPMMMDDWGVDVLISASQKGLMSLPGAAFLWFSQRAAARPRAGLATPYWDWHPRAGAGRDSLWRFWCGTPPVQQIHALDEALRMLLDEEGLASAWARHAALARTVWAAVDAWGDGHPGIRMAIAEPPARAASVTAIHLPGATRLRGWLTAQCGVTLGVGLGAAEPENALRVAHMGHCNAATVLGTLAAMQAGMLALAIPHGKGALDAAAAVVAEPA